MKKRKEKYWNTSLPVETRVNDLVKRMTLEEKVNQLYAIWATPLVSKDKLSIPKARKILGKGLGQISCILRPLDPKKGARIANEIQKFAIENTRLGIPIIIHDECLHGCVAKGSTIFPQSLGIASTWNPALMEKIARSIGQETSARGIHQALSPTINIARDGRCGRVEETYGEDPYLTSRMAVAFVKGLQSQKVVATPKHFAANFVGDGGRDSYPIHFSEMMLREIYFPAFEACFKEANALSVMSAYGSINGVPSTADRWLLTDVLRKEWGFKGFVVSDYFSVVMMHNFHHTAATKAEAAQHAIEAGMDVELPGADCFRELKTLIQKGKLSKKAFNESVRRVLRVKFWLGLFDNPYVEPNYAAAICDCFEHRQLALETARQSMVLLKNKNLLPLSQKIKSVAVIGPNAKPVSLGGYSGSGIKVITPFEGIKNKVSMNTQVHFAEGCKLVKGTRKGFKEAINIAKKSDVAVLFMGNSVGYGLQTEGENADRCDLNLLGFQEELIKEVAQVNKKMLVVLINGSPVTMNKWLGKVAAVVEAWYPGEEGGNAIADVLWGDYNPSGKLPISFPIVTGQSPHFYNHKPTGRRDDYVDLRGRQFQFPFGHGLSYTKFHYKNLKIKKDKSKDCLEVKVSLTVRNVGKLKGDEVIQLYIRDVVSSLSRPVKELKGFKRLSLVPSEKRKVKFVLSKKDLSFLNSQLEPILEPGTFEIMVGSSSEDIRLKGCIEV